MATQALRSLQADGSVVSCPLFDPRLERANRQRFYREEIPELRLANSLYCPSGTTPARGWILVRRADYNLLPSPYATDFQLQIDDLSGRGALLFQNLVLVQARCVSRGIAADPNAIYLVELTDRRGVLTNPWDRFPTNSQYNVVSQAYPGQFDLASEKGGIPFTWNQMVGNLWAQQGPFLGAYPGLPVVPTGTPEGWSFPGEGSLSALGEMLEHLGLSLSANLLLASPYGIVQPGATDASFTALQAQFAGFMEEDLEWIDVGSGRVPGQVLVYFHRRNEFFGTEETVRNDLLAWSTNAIYAVVVPAPAPYTAAAGTGHVWSDFTVRYDENSLPLAADVVTAAAIAAQEASDYYTRVTRGALGFMNRVYSGALPFATGSQVDGVCWKMDGGGSDKRWGWRTQIIRGPDPPWNLLAGVSV